MEKPVSPPAVPRSRRASLNLRGERAASAAESLWLLHPGGCPPSKPTGPAVLIDPPGIMASSAAWTAYRDRLKARVEWDGHPTYRAYQEAAERVLAWRSALHPDLAFWNLD